MKKKIAIIAAVGCALTISGVYATWAYSQGSAGSVSESIIPQMAGVANETKKGKIEIKTSTVTFVIDDSGDYTPELQITGSALCTFTANPGADQDVTDNGIPMAYTITMSENWWYDSDFDGIDDRPIFVIDPAYANVAVNDGNPVKSFEITAEDFKKCVKLNLPVDGEDNPNFKLDTLEKYNNFKTSLNKASSLFTVTVTEITA